MKNEFSVVVTGSAWMGSGTGSIETAMEHLFREARREILITSYAISSAADDVLDWVIIAAGKGVLIRMAVNKISTQPDDVRARLHEINFNYPHFHLYTFEGDETEDLHAKAIVADRNMALVGSSNLSRRGLITNHELAILIRGEQAQNVASVLDKLFLSPVLVKLIS
jgi:cardiolipin synthase